MDEHISHMFVEHLKDKKSLDNQLSIGYSIDNRNLNSFDKHFHQYISGIILDRLGIYYYLGRYL